MKATAIFILATALAAFGQDLNSLKARAYDAIKEIQRQKELLRDLSAQIESLSGPTMIEPSGANLESGAKDATYAAVTNALARRPEWEAEFKLAYAQIKSVENFERQELENTLNVIRRMPIKEMKGDSSSILIDGEVIAFQPDKGMMRVIEKPEELKSILRGMAQGMSKARPEWGNPKPPPSPIKFSVFYPKPLPLYDERSRKARPTEVK